MQVVTKLLETGWRTIRKLRGRWQAWVRRRGTQLHVYMAFSLRNQS